MDQSNSEDSDADNPWYYILRSIPTFSNESRHAFLCAYLSPFKQKTRKIY